MAEKNEQVPIYITVDSKKISRCKWCGTLESNNWVTSADGVYCSQKCNLASEIDVSGVCSLLWLILSPFFVVVIGFTRISMTLLTSIIVWIFLVIIFSPVYYVRIQGSRHRKNIPKDSRMDESLLEAELLKAVSTAVVCPRCDANIDLQNLGPRRTYTCTYCGTTGTINIITSDTS